MSTVAVLRVSVAGTNSASELTVDTVVAVVAFVVSLVVDTHVDGVDTGLAASAVGIVAADTMPVVDLDAGVAEDYI